MSYAVPPPPIPTLPVEGASELLPVHRIYCIGRNYAAHAREMGADPEREPPFFFMKPADAVVPSGATIAYPPATSELHHEVELVVALGRGGREVAAEHALELVYGYAVGIDLTRRDLQDAAKKMGRPWDMAKGFDHSAPCSAVVPASRIGHPVRGEILLSVNGAIRQRGDIAMQIWTVPEAIAYLSRLVTLAPGDLLFTGTPEGVGPIGPSDRLQGSIDGVGQLALSIV